MLELWSHVVLGEQFRAACIPFLMSPFAIVVASKHAAQIRHACHILEVLSTGRCSKPALRQSLGSSDPQALGWPLGGGKDASLHEILELTSGRDSDWKAVSSSRWQVLIRSTASRKEISALQCKLGKPLCGLWLGDLDQIWGFPKIRGTIMGVPIIRIIVYWGLYWGALILGNYHVSRLDRWTSLVRRG